MKNRLSKVIISICALSMMMSTTFFVGCGSSKMTESSAPVTFDSGDYYDDSFSYEYEDVAVAEESAALTGAGSGKSAEILDGSRASDRKLITTVNMSLEATDMDECMSRIRTKAGEAGGYMESENIERSVSSFTVRVPSDKLSAFLDDVKANSNVVSYSSSVEDVTLSYVDIESRIDSLKTERKRLDELLAGADTMEEIIALESRLSEVRYELQSYESQRRTYDNRIDYSTVYITIRKVEVYTPEEEATAGERISLGLSDSFHSLGDGLREFGIWFIINLPILSFWAIVLGGIFCAVFFPIRSRKKRRAKKEAKRAAKMKEKAPEPEQPAENNDTPE